MLGPLGRIYDGVRRRFTSSSRGDRVAWFVQQAALYCKLLTIFLITSIDKASYLTKFGLMTTMLILDMADDGLSSAREIRRLRYRSDAGLIIGLKAAAAGLETIFIVLFYVYSVRATEDGDEGYYANRARMLNAAALILLNITRVSINSCLESLATVELDSNMADVREAGYRDGCNHSGADCDSGQSLLGRTAPNALSTSTRRRSALPSDVGASGEQPTAGAHVQSNTLLSRFWPFFGPRNPGRSFAGQQPLEAQAPAPPV